MFENSEAHYKALFESSPDGKIILVAQTGIITDVNPVFCQMVGLSYEQVLGKNITFFDFFNEVIIDYQDFPEYLQTKKAFFEDLTVTSPLGTKIYIDLSAYLFTSNNQELIHCNLRDTTHRQKAREQVRLFTRAIQQSPVSVVITDKNGRIEYVNPKFTEVSGYTLEDVYGLNPRLGQKGAHPEGFYENLWNTILSGKDWSGEFHNSKKNGESFWETATISPLLRDDGEISHFIAVKEDITEKKKILEDLIRTKEKAEESDRLKSAFLANMSHEIRTPMTGILGFASLLKEPHLTGEEQQEYIKVIEESGARMLNIINEIVEISKIESGEMKLVFKEINLCEQMDYIYKFFKPTIEAKGMKLIIEKKLSYEEAFITTDAQKLSNILMNLVKNAMKFTADGYVAIRCERNGSYIQFCVKDTGIGIPLEKQTAVFDRFIQADMSENRAYEGAGLGLSITKAYVEMLGGKIWLKSTPGEGSSFYFTIPGLKKINEEVEKGIEKNGLLSKKLKVLIAEDDKFTTTFLSKIIQKHCNEIITVGNGLEAVNTCIKRKDLDLVLMDYHMPQMNGYEAAAQIRKFNTDVKIFGQTAFVFSHDREEALRYGCNECITKPIQANVLDELLMKYFSEGTNAN
jgi:PAS domain S-box-containing protein